MFRHAVRALRRAPGFSLTSVAVVALATGTLAASGAILYSIVLKPFPVQDQRSVVIAWTRDNLSGFAHWPFASEQVEAIRPGLLPLADLAGIDYNGALPLSLRESDRPTRLPTGLVSGNFFGVLGVRPVLGRLIAPRDDVRGGPLSIVISETFWRSHFASAPDIVGRVLQINGRPVEVIGVVPADFAVPRHAVAWVPNSAWLAKPEWESVDLVARLKPGVTRDAFEAALTAGIVRTAPADDRPYIANRQPVIQSFADLAIGDVRASIYTVFAGALLVLIVAGANFAGLLVVRIRARQHELTIRSALGAGRGQVVRSVWTEALAVLGAGFIVAVPVALLLLKGFLALAPADLARMTEIQWAPIPAAGAGIVAAVMLCAIAWFPAWHASRGASSGDLRTRGRSIATGWRNDRLRPGLVAGQLALAVAVLAAAILLVRTVDQMRKVDLGFKAEGLWHVELVRSGPDRSDTERLAQMERVIGAVRALPEVRGVTATLMAPLAGDGGFYAKTRTPGMSNDQFVKVPFAALESTGPDYFATLGLPVIEGRSFSTQDGRDSPGVAIVNQDLARALWPGQRSVGQRIWGGTSDTTRWRTVVGVVATARYNELLRPMPALYIPHAQAEYNPSALLVRTDPQMTGSLVRALVPAIRNADPSVAIRTVAPIEELLAKPIERPRLTAIVLACFASVTLALAAIGLLGVLTLFVGQRTREIGVRMALGANAASVRRLVLREALTPVALGLLAGLGLALVVGRLLQSLLYQVSPADPVALLGAMVGLSAVGVIAVAGPTRRATSIDPLIALKAE